VRSRVAIAVFLQGQGLGDQQMISAINVQGAVQLMREFDGFAGEAALCGQRRQGDGVRSQSDDVVRPDNSVVAQAEAAGEIEVARQGAKVASGFGGAMSESLVVIGAETIKHGVGVFYSGGAGETKFADQTVLKGAPGALDAAFGLGRVGGNLGDAESRRARVRVGWEIVFRRVLRRASSEDRYAGRCCGGRDRD
jgi:hypothetical protein